MKTAEEWMKELRHDCSYGEPVEPMEHLLKRVQLDALKEGMRRAADLKPNMMQTEVYGETEHCWRTGYNAGTAEHCSNILSAAEQLTIKNL